MNVNGAPARATVGRFKVVDTETGLAIEIQDTDWHAQRAAMILDAHELKNGRKTKYAVVPLLFKPYTFNELRLEGWVLEEFDKLFMPIT